MFDLLVKMGFKEIEIGFPSASATDFAFVRTLIENDRIPDDVHISVLTQAREDLIDRTAQSLIGARSASIHLYNALSELFRRVVFQHTPQQTKELARQGTRWIMDYAEKYLPDVEFGYEYSPEIFTQTPTDYALEVCEAVMDVWQPGPGREIILNLPATVEMSTPNTYADQIEYFSRGISRREFVALSLHAHNDRGTAIAATELALMAGADRVEGCLFGHGERTGNVDLITLAMNLFSQGIDPGLDLSNIDEIRRTVEYCTGLPVHPRHPYAGDLVFTAFSGSHQDGIKKGLEDLALRAEAQGLGLHEIPWQAPYLAIDPADVGRSYEAVIRVNSQSGKGGMAYLMKTDHHFDLPRRLQLDFSRAVQRYTDATGKEVSSSEILDLFTDEYLAEPTRVALQKADVASTDGQYELTASVTTGGQCLEISGEGNGPVSAFVDALGQLGYEVRVLDFSEHALSAGGDAQAAAYVETEITVGNDTAVWWGVGIDPSIIKASLKAVCSALDRAYRDLGNG
jgi:2-isopropylmalate synthase